MCVMCDVTCVSGEWRALAGGSVFWRRELQQATNSPRQSSTGAAGPPFCKTKQQNDSSILSLSPHRRDRARELARLQPLLDDLGGDARERRGGAGRDAGPDGAPEGLGVAGVAVDLIFWRGRGGGWVMRVIVLFGKGEGW